MSNQASSVRLLIVAGEPSGDRAGAAVLREIQRLTPCESFGVGGGALSAAGLELVADINDLTALGVVETCRRLGKWLDTWCQLRTRIEQSRPTAALLIDAPEINLPLARILTQRQIPVIYYIGPQVWAWRPQRLSLIKSRVRAVALILPFEKPIYDRVNIPAKFVGHPAVDHKTRVDAAAVRQKLAVANETPLVALLPGSRPSEIRHHQGAMMDAARELDHRGISAVYCPPSDDSAPAPPRTHRPTSCRVRPPTVSIPEILGTVDAALIASGTATLEAACQHTPMAVIYRIDPLSYFVGQRLLKIPYIGLPNWVAGKKIVPELVQHEVTGRKLAAAAIKLLTPKEQTRQRRELIAVAQSLGRPGAANKVAQLVLGHLR